MGNEEQTFWNDCYIADPTDPLLPDRILDDELEGLPAGTALDLGCGTGLNAIKLANQGWDVTGVDFSVRAIEIAAKTADERNLKANFISADITNWESPRQFDLVYSTYALPEGKAREDALRTATKALKPAGTLLIAEWDISMLKVWKHFSPDDLLTPEKIAHGLPELTTLKAEVKHISDFFPKDDMRWHGESWGNVAIVKATKP